MKLKQRMLIVIIGSILVVLAAMLSYIGNRNQQTAIDSATALASTTSEKVAVTVQKDIERAMITARTIASNLKGMKSTNMTNRITVKEMLKKVLEDDPSFLGSWTLWEPNTFDGLDKKFANTEGNDATGTLNSAWTRTGANLNFAPAQGYDQPGAGDYYLLARNSGQETILSPYTYKIGDKDVLMTSLVVPIKIDDKVVGVAGVDFTLDHLQTMTEQFKLFNTGSVSIYSNDGSIVTSPKPEQMGKKINEVLKDESVTPIAAAIHDGTMYKVNTNGSYKLFSPIVIGQSKTPWSVGITIPMKEITAQSNQQLYLTIAAGIVGLILLAGVVLLLTNTIIKPIAASVAIGEKMAKGDFTQDVPKKYLQRKDEIGVLATVFENITKNMRTMIGQVSLNASQVAGASEQISASAEELASGNNVQAESAQMINELFQKLSITTNSVAKKAEQASELSNKTASIAMDGGKVVKQSIEGMNLVNEKMSRLEEDSNKIGEIIEVIDDIAEQTNLLALNAAIEAARAGEQGRGFAVVADEVRKLAERSGEATKQITGIIKGMQENTRQSVKAVGEGVGSSEKTGEAFDHIVSMVNQSAHTVAEIAGASQEQTAQSSDVLASIESISAATEEAAASSEETAATAQSLAQLADELNNAIAVFKIK